MYFEKATINCAKFVESNASLAMCEIKSASNVTLVYRIIAQRTRRAFQIALDPARRQRHYTQQKQTYLFHISIIPHITTMSNNCQ